MPPVISFLVLLGIVVGFGSILVFVTSKLGPRTSADKSKNSPYECGLEPVEPEEKKISVNYYLTAILFVLFDIEIVFLYPWAIVYKDFIKEGLGLYAFIGVAVFLTIFIVGLFWEIKSKALKWN
ncbi:MAG: NADH-quinone oxidoreductase subunit A [Bdellovibrionales bacterium]